MNRRALLSAAALLALPFPALAQAAGGTRWKVRPSEGMDAIAFLGPLSGKEFYARYYGDELAAFKPKLPADALEALASLHAEADAAGGLLWPGLTLIFSGGPTDRLDDVLASLAKAETVLKPSFAASTYWDEADWNRFLAGRERLAKVLNALKAADFAGFRHGLSPRAGIGLLRAARAWALLHGRDAVLPEVVQWGRMRWRAAQPASRWATIWQRAVTAPLSVTIMSIAMS